MKLLPLIALLAFCNALPGQQAGASGTGFRTFTSPDGAFQVNYSGSLVKCESDARGNWKTYICLTYVPICNADPSGGTVLCLAYPRGKTAQGTIFDSAAFSVTEITDADSQSKCLRLSDPPAQYQSVHPVTINGTEFVTAELGGVASGHVLDGDVYRTFHQGRCYELDIRIVTYDGTGYDPGTLKGFDLKPVKRSLQQVLASFKFLH